jgi:basic amino acid/polyamine antiporter, APA family
MIGAGIFTTSGFIARDVGSAWKLIALWAVGGAIALAGALAYGELGAAIPEAGGEYVYLREAYGGLLAYLSGWTSLAAGFSGAIAAALFGLAGYLRPLLNAAGIPAVDPRIIALAALWALTTAHAAGVSAGGRIQASLTAATVGAIVVLIASGLCSPQGARENFLSAALPQSSVAVSLIFILYAYSGWNAAAYLAGEIRDPGRNIPRALAAGTAIVAALYLGLNAMYVYALPIAAMSGTLDIAARAAGALFGAREAQMVGALIALAILSSASAMVMAGPRVYYAMARDGVLPRALGAVSPRSHVPVRAILLQSAWTSVLILFFAAFEPIVVYTGFAVTLFAALAVAAVIALRVRRPELVRPFRMPCYPWLALAYLAVTGWILAYTVSSRPLETLYGTLAICAGIPLYYLGPMLARFQLRTAKC